MKDIIVDKPPMFIELYNSTERVVVSQGGTSSGKTYTILDVLFTIAISKNNSIITIVGQDIPNLKAGAYRDSQNIISDSSIYPEWIDRINHTDRTIYFKNGSIMEFKSYSDEQDAKSGKRQYLFVNEANGIPFQIYQRLEERTYDKIFIDYNPSAKFWVHEELIGKPDVKLIISDHRHNPFLSPEVHARIEAYTGERFKVYSRGLTGKMDGLIFSNWDLCDEMPESSKRWVGIDWGYVNDPTAIVDVRLQNGELWLDEIEYRTGMTNTAVSKALNDAGIGRNIEIIADSNENKSIDELYNMGHNIDKTRKGAGSINAGIDIMLRYKIHITRRSKNLRKEFGAYEWKKDRLTGQSTNTPIDEFNHAIDAIRYVCFCKMGISTRAGEYKTRTIRRPGLH